MKIVQEEIFGPVVAAMPFDDPDEVLSLANDSTYGLAAAVWTRDVTKAHRLARRLKAGTVWINCYQYLRRRLALRRIQAVGLGPRNGPGGRGALYGDQGRDDAAGVNGADNLPWLTRVDHLRGFRANWPPAAAERICPGRGRKHRGAGPVYALPDRRIDAAKDLQTARPQASRPGNA